MKKNKIFLLLIAVFTILLIMPIYAATKDDVISAITRTYEIGDSSFKLPDGIVNKAKNYLNSHPLDEEKYDNILGCIDNAVKIAEKNGTTDITKMDRSDIREGLSLMIEASESANVDLDEQLSNVDLSTIGNESSNNTEEVNQNDNQASETTENAENINVDGNTTSNNDNSNELISNIINQIQDNTQTNTKNNSQTKTEKKSTNIDITVKRNMTLIIVGIILTIFLLIFIFYLIFKTKWYKIIKYILMIILVVLILAALVALIMILVNYEELRMIYKLYYIFK